MRLLYHVSVMHNTADESLPKSWEPPEVDIIWNLIEQRLKTLNLDCSRLNIYQDSHVEIWGYDSIETFREMANKGSRNAQILLNYISKGATVKNTESMGRLVLGLFGAIVTCPFGKYSDRLCKPFDIWREKYIAQQINQTLKNNQVGLLFLGVAHGYLTPYLDSDIRVEKVVSIEDIEAIQKQLATT